VGKFRIKFLMFEFPTRKLFRILSINYEQEETGNQKINIEYKHKVRLDEIGVWLNIHFVS
jgi:hypothetical protein